GGRLWVICTGCARWNLTPFEARWEALEECERAFRAARMRHATENMGMARLPEGLELIRVGEPAEREFAGWRYGATFLRRNRRAAAVTLAAWMLPIGLVTGTIPAVLPAALGTTGLVYASSLL